MVSKKFFQSKAPTPYSLLPTPPAPAAIRLRRRPKDSRLPTPDLHISSPNPGKLESPVPDPQLMKHEWYLLNHLPVRYQCLLRFLFFRLRHHLLPLHQDVRDNIHQIRPTLFLPATCKTVPLPVRSEEHTSELQSQSNLVCRLLLEKKKKKIK